MAAGGISPLRMWLQVVDRHLTPEGLEFVKLCVYSEINYAQYQSLKLPSKLFDHLLDRCYQSDETKTLQIFTYALNHVGRDLHGVYLVEDCMSKYGLLSPPPLQEDALSNEFKFCLCMVKIGTKSRGMNIELKLKKRFSRPRFLDMHHGNLLHLPDLFVKLLQKKMILWNDTHHLCEAFENHGARQCLRYLNEYHKKVGLPPISSVDGDEEDTCSPSANPTELEDTSDCEKIKKRRQPSHAPVTTELMILGQLKDPSINVSRSAPTTQGSHFPQVTDMTKGLRDYTDPDSQSDDSDEDSKKHLLEEKKKAPKCTEDTLVFQTQQQSTGRSSKRKRCCCVWIIATVLCLFLFGVFFGTTWFNLIPRKPGRIQGREGTTIILGEVNQFFTQKIQVHEDFFSTESHTVDIYRFNSECAGLPVEKNIETVTEFTNFTNAYLLPGSVLEFDLILSPSNHSTNSDYIVVYLTRGLEAVFNPHQLQGQIVFKERIYFDSPLYHYSHQVPETERGYHSLHFLLPSTPFVYSLNLTFVNVTIDNSSPSVYHECTLYNKICSITLAFSASKICLLADILSTNADDPFLEIDMGIALFQLAPVLSVTLTLFVIVVIGIAIVAGCMSHRFCKTSCSNT